ncbi:hypothetical protein [Clostridium botulinum]|uniref:hypothetical protein n=1 Tax=Clostridium botulinum TaxID=1491 RepID=UPI00064C9C4B|nr:hypothetical protein [Clostridium botulinum]KLU74584.1 hypothetical protein CBC3_13715 [Clostridium botulinum V891]KOA73245.1 hypothetical protein ADU78_12955 [Clostridium botulinum]KOA95788.1 hypothetical protein ADU76_00205 [Clostridium botulinum]KOC30779.1 hypothetical protein ADU81_14700 [Clostridium botulinum]MCD3204531.1 hypothetical protein [Clostridium botulinum C/D]
MGKVEYIYKIIFFILIFGNIINLFRIIKKNNTTKYDFILKTEKGNKRLVIMILVIISILSFRCMKNFTIIDSAPILALLAYVINYKKVIGLTPKGIVYYYCIIKWEDIFKYEFKDKNLLIINDKFYFEFQKEKYNDISNFIKVHLNN